MTTIFIKLLLLSLFYVLVFGYECGLSYNQQKPSLHIIRRLLEGDWPWIVAIFDNDIMICTGSIISPRFVLTAAHCFNEQTLNNETNHSFSIRAGTVNATKGKVVRVKKIKTFDEAVPGMPRNDIAVLELERPLKFNHNVSSICLPKFFEEFPGNMAYLAGFGNVLPKISNDPIYAENNALLNDVTIPFQDFEHCEKASQYWNYTSLNYICAGAKMKGSSYGDGGEPLMIKDVVFQQGKFKSRWVAVGVVVGGHYLYSNTNDPLKWSHALHTRVSHYCDWIEDVTDGEAQCIDVGRQFLPTQSTFTTKIVKKDECLPDGKYFDLTNSCYYLYKIGKTWKDAKQHCIKTQSNLMSIHSEEENNFIGKLIKNSGNHVWTGLYLTFGKRWRWIEDGSEATFFNWQAGEPNNVNGREDVVVMNYVSYEWVDIPRSSAFYFVCKRKL